MDNFKGSDFFVFGYFGYQTNQLDGQTVKTRAVHQLLEDKLGSPIKIYDTENLKSGKHSLIWALFKLLRAKNIIYLPAHRNLKNFFPVLFFLSNIFNFNVHYFVVGGWLPEFVKSNQALGKKLKRIKAIYVETDTMLKNLKAAGFQNVHWFPNFRSRQLYLTSSNEKNDQVFKMVFMSRINKLKGIDVIFRFLEWSRNQSFYQQIKIDFYGQIDAKDEAYFFENIDTFPNVAYKGVLQPDQIQTAISQYDLFLFPTRYPGEGCPGAIIDAFMASLPVLASNWRYNAEFVKEGETGFLFNLDDEPQFYNKIKFIISNKHELISMKQNSQTFSHRFTSESAWNIIKDNIIN